MSQGPLIWAGGLAGSLAAHAAMGAVLLWAIQPDPVEDQPVPETQMRLSAYQVERSDAAEAQPDAEAAAEGDTSGTRMGQGAIAQSRAEPVRPDTQALTAALPETETQAAAQPDTKTQTAARPDTPTQAAVQPDAARLAAAEPDATQAPGAELTAVNLPAVSETATQIGAAEPQSQSLAAVEQVFEPAAPALLTAVNLPAVVQPAVQMAAATPESQPIAAAVQDLNRVPEATLTAVNLASAPAPSVAVVPGTPEPVAIGEATPQPVAMTEAEPDVTQATAMLAFAGAGEGPIDPVSLAAFQSFMAPGEAAGTELRDGLAGLLNSIPCSRMQVQFQPETNTLELIGHVPEDGLRAPVLEALQAQMGANITVADNLLILPSPQCGALSGIAGVGLPQSTDQITNPLLVGEDTHAREFRYTEGQQLVLDLTGADYDAYVYVDYFDAKGQVIHLSPNDSIPLALTPAKSAFRVGADAPSDPGLYITIGPPYGQEIAVAFAASDPLYEGLRPIIEPAEPYLDWLQTRVSAARDANPDFKGEWVYFFVATAPS
ncbi:MAG: DUF4384 domain-containing protein [Pseudomonadota bacterium]